MESNLWDHFKNLEEPHRLTHILFFQLVDKDSFNRCFMSWVSSVAREVEGRTVSIDGKTIRCASKMSDDALPIHILSAWADENGMVIAQLQLDWQEDKDKNAQGHAQPEISGAPTVEAVEPQLSTTPSCHTVVTT